MTAVPKPKRRPLIMDKARVRELADELNRRIGFVPDPNATAEESRRLSLECGINPEDNEFSREIIRMRNREYGDE